MAFALAVRSHTVSLAAVAPHLPEMIGLLTGGMASAFYGARLVARLSNVGLVSAITTMLGQIGVLMITEDLLRVSLWPLLALWKTRPSSTSGRLPTISFRTPPNSSNDRNGA